LQLLGQSGGNLGTGRDNGTSAQSGTQDAALYYGGDVPPAFNSTNTEEYNGLSWTAGGSLGTARGNGAGGAGIQTAAFVLEDKVLLLLLL
jgi:hypothetical protein